MAQTSKKKIQKEKKTPNPLELEKTDFAGACWTVDLDFHG
jgi:hypothetical protein